MIYFYYALHNHIALSPCLQTGKDWEPGSMSALNMAKVVGVPGLNPLGLHTELFTAKETPRPSRLLKERMLEPEEAQ